MTEIFEKLKDLQDILAEKYAIQREIEEGFFLIIKRKYFCFLGILPPTPATKKLWRYPII